LLFEIELPTNNFSSLEFTLTSFFLVSKETFLKKAIYNALDKIRHAKK